MQSHASCFIQRAFETGKPENIMKNLVSSFSLQEFFNSRECIPFVPLLHTNRVRKFIRQLLLLVVVLLIPTVSYAQQVQLLVMEKNYPHSLYNPSYQSRNGDYVELMGVERWTNATIMNLKFFWNGRTTGLSVNNKFYLVDKAGGRKYQARYVMNVAYSPHFTSISSVWEHTLYFQIIFPSLPDGIDSLDLCWDVPSDGFDFYGIKVGALFSKPAPSSCPLPQTGSEAPRLRRTASTVQVPMNQYNTNYQFHDGMLAVYDKDLYGYGFIDEKGKKCTKFEWYYPTMRLGHEPAYGGGYCLVCKRKEHTEYWYVIDKEGNVTASLGSGVIRVHPFNKDGYANVVVREGGEQKAMIINGQGKEVFPHLSKKPVYASQYPYILDPFYEDLAAFKDGKTGNWGFIDRTGKIVIPPRYEHVDRFSEGLAAVQFKATDTQTSLWGYIDRTGSVVIQPKFRIQPGRFSEQIAIVTKYNEKQVAMDMNGRIISKEWNEISPFRYGRAIADGKYVIDRSMNIVNGPFLRGGTTGLSLYQDSYRQNMYKCKFGSLLFPSGYFYPIDGVEVVSDKLLHFKNSNLDGFIDVTGNVAFEFVESEF